jgi:hypothetical protein
MAAGIGRTKAQAPRAIFFAVQKFFLGRADFSGYKAACGFEVL